MTMVVMGDTCVQSITAIRRLPEALSFIVAMAMVVMGVMCVQSIMTIHTIIRLLCWLFVVVIYCCHGDGSDGRHVCTKYHGHTYYYHHRAVICA